MAPPLRLTGRRILVTRASGRVSELATLLSSEGAEVISIPTIEIVPPDSYDPLDTALARLNDFDWLVFTSVHAVEVFAQRRDPKIIPRQIAVIGPATAKAVEQAGLSISLMPPHYIAESLIEALAPKVANTRVLMIRAAEAREILPAGLTQAGARLTVVDAYRNRIPPEAQSNIKDLFKSSSDYPDAITFTSASTARNLAALFDAAELALPRGIVLASIGPITSQAMRDQGIEPTVEASEATIAALTQIISSYFEISPARIR